MNTAVLDYQVDDLENAPLFWSTGTKPEPSGYDVAETEPEHLPVGPEVQFEVEEYDFGSLGARLVEFEREHGFSSLEMFAQYTRGELNLTENSEEWLDLFILYLGTHEVRQFSCP